MGYTRDTRTAQALHERDDELALIASALEDARTGAGGLLIVEGEPGIGKSALLQAGAELALEGGMQVLRARAGELEREFPFGCVLQLFERRLRDAPADERERLLSGAASHAALLFEPAPEAHGQQLFSILNGLFWITALLAEDRPALISLDDAHWADTPSLRFVLYLAQRVADLPVVALVGTRSGEPGGEDALLPRLRAHPDARVIRPRPLGTDSIAQLIHAHVGRPDDEFVAACSQAVGGNPLLLRELLHAVATEDRPPTAESAELVWDIAPAPVQRALSVTLARLPAAATAVARAAAVLGDEATVDGVAALGAVSADGVARQVAALRAAEVLADRSEIRFAHPILRSALYHALTGPERAVAHRRAAAILAERRAAPEAIATHLLESPPVGEPWALAALRAAAERANTRGLPQVAAQLLRRAGEEPLSNDEETELTLELGRMEAAAGAPEAADRLRSALGSVPSGAARAAALRDIGRLAHGQGRFGDAVQAFEEALGELSEDADEMRLSLRAEHAGSALWLPDGGVAAADELAVLLDRSRSPRTQSERIALATLAGAAMLRGEDRELATSLALRAWGDGTFMAESSADDPALPALTGALVPADEFAAARSIASAAIDDAQARGSAHGFANGSFMRASTWLMEGRPREAAADAAAAVSSWAYGWSAFLPAAHWVLCTAHLELGDIEAAQAATVLSPDAEKIARENTGYFTLLIARGSVALAQSRYDEALLHLEEAAQVRERLGTDNPAFIGWRQGAVGALLGLGRTEEARALASELLELARRWGAPRTLGLALRTLAETGAEESLAILEEAVAVLEPSGADLELARTLLALGVALRRASKPSAAREPLRRALDLAESTGGSAVAGRARQELVAAGGRPRRGRLSGPASLTPQELQVARLAAGGNTNREIAESLFVTIKAVKWHLGNTYSKLGISSREDLPAALNGAREES